jgi:hypothetical protein
MKRTTFVVLAVAMNVIAVTAWGQDASPLPADNAAPPPPIEEKAVAETAAPPTETPTLERFQQSLSPYGRWVRTPEYGLVWIPNGVGPDWRPYSHGQWAYTSHGWTFVSYDPWGWAPFHYGRWVYYPVYGWAWIPGYRWAPAWVSWRYGAGYIGWAPLGPVGVSVGYYNYPSAWMFVRGPHFYRPLARHYFVPTVRVNTVFHRTYFAGIPRVGVYHSPPAAYVSRVVGRPVVRVSARVVAPRWVARGTVYQPRVALGHAYRSARVQVTPRGVAPYRPIARPAPSYRPRPYAPSRPSYRAPGTFQRPPAHRAPRVSPRPVPRPAPRTLPRTVTKGKWT